MNMNYFFRDSKLVVLVTVFLVVTGCAKHPNLRPVTDPAKRYTGNGFSVLTPQGKGWYIQDHGPYAVAFSKPIVKNHTFVASVEMMKPEAMTVVLSTEFPKAIEHLLNEALDGTDDSRFSLISVKVAPFGPQGSYCSQYDIVQEERSNPLAPDIVLEITAHGFVCLDTSSKFMVRADYSERKPKEVDSILDDTFKLEVEAFLKNVTFTPLFDS